ncbi:MAG: FAD-dependent oxidoreductase [Christensenellaceae bacterium]|nr:FAD-dependent oxidoreductase [Christensenellaceae bacterium]
MPQRDMLIIGSGPAAWSCALTARQRNLSVTVAAAVSETSWLQRAERIDNYPGMPGVSGKELLRVFRQQAIDAGAEVVEALARQIMPAGKGYMTLCGNDIIESRSLVLAMGAARPKLLPGEEALLGQGVSWCGTCDGMFFRGKKVAVLSAWHGGIEEAEFLHGLCSQVDYYTLAKHAMPENPPFALCEGTPQSLEKADGGIDVVTDKGRAHYDGVFIFRPAVSPGTLLPGLAIEGAFIPVDRRMATNLPHVYACGDCTGQPLQIAKAVGEGNVAAISAAEDLAPKKGESAT